jgi:thioredoxin 1
MSSLSQVTQASFSTDVLQSDVPMLVDFYADWCGPCRMLAPVLSRLSAEFAGRVKIVKVNVDSEPQLAGQFQVESIPTLVFFNRGKVVGRTAGMAPEEGLRQVLTRLASAAAAASGAAR